MAWSDRLAALERKFVGIAMAVMGVVVFLDVVHRIAATRGSLSKRLFGEGETGELVGVVVSAIVLIVAVRGALAMRGHAGGPKAWGTAVGVVAAFFCALKLFVVVVPNGLIWSKTLGLVLMLWIGLVGASLATHDRRHLALDLGAKLWPKKLLPIIQGVGNVVTALFCFMMAVLAVMSIVEHFHDFQNTDGAGGVYPDLPIVPKFLAFTILPTGFALMGARFVAQALESFGGRVEEDDAMHMIGMDQAAQQENEQKEAQS